MSAVLQHPAVSDLQAAAVEYARRGWYVFPLQAGTKGIHLTGEGGYHNASNDPEQVRRWWQRWPDANIGLNLAASGLVALDPDLYKPDCEWWAFIEGHELPDTLVQSSARGGKHYIFTAPPDASFAGKVCEGVEIKHKGYILVEPSVFEGGKYVFETDDDPAPVPDWVPRSDQADRPKQDNSLPSYTRSDLERARKLLAEKDNDLDRDEWVKLAIALKGVFGDEIRADFLEFSYRWQGGAAEGDPERVWRTAKPSGKVGLGTVFFLLGGAVDLTEDGVARVFTERHGGSLRFDHDQGRWYRWTGDRWAADNTHLAFSYCREIARELSAGVSKSDQAKARKASFAGGVERMARADRAHAVTSEVWDQDPFLLGCPGVTVDLQTGELNRPQPTHGITKQTAVAPGGHCPRWLDFLHDATNGDVELIRFLQQWCGYSLTGDTREHALLFVYGPGGNGKSVFLETVSHILGDYATTASMDTFTASSSDRHPTDLAMLRGARLVTASETEEGRAWAESRIKQLTGGDKISARFMRQDFFTFTPQFKLTVVGNHKPRLKNVDDAARRRFNIVPFITKPARPDRALTEKLKAEAPGILQWMIEGCLDWQRNGLVRPQSVLDATAEYFSAQDLFGQWLEDCCRVEPDNRHLTATAKELFESWKGYAHAAGEDPGSQKALGERLGKHGLEPDRNRSGRFWRGIELHKPEMDAWLNN